MIFLHLQEALFLIQLMQLSKSQGYVLLLLKRRLFPPVSFSKLTGIIFISSLLVQKVAYTIILDYKMARDNSITLYTCVQIAVGFFFEATVFFCPPCVYFFNIFKNIFPYKTFFKKSALQLLIYIFSARARNICSYETFDTSQHSTVGLAVLKQ